MTKLLLFGFLVLVLLVFLDGFPLFLHFLTSLIKPILWLKFSTDKRQAEDMRDKDHRVLLCFSEETSKI